MHGIQSHNKSFRSSDYERSPRQNNQRRSYDYSFPSTPRDFSPNNQRVKSPERHTKYPSSINSSSKHLNSQIGSLNFNYINNDFDMLESVSKRQHHEEQCELSFLRSENIRLKMNIDTLHKENIYLKSVISLNVSEEAKKKLNLVKYQINELEQVSKEAEIISKMSEMLVSFLTNM